MEIHQLTLIVDDDDLNGLAERHLPKDVPMSGLLVRVLPEGVQIKGHYKVVVRVPFETLWSVRVESGKVVVELERMRALGLPVTKLRGILMKLIRQAAGGKAWLEHNSQRLIVNVEDTLAEGGISMALNLRAIRCLAGRLELTAGLAEL